MRKLTVEDFLKMEYTKLLAWWLWHKLEFKTATPERLEKNCASFEAHGRDTVACILASCEYVTEDSPLKEISLKEAAELLLSIRKDEDYRLFSVGFVKREDQTFRKMVCRYGVTKHLKGGEKPFEDKDYNLTTVYDPSAQPRYSNAEKAALLSNDPKEVAKVTKPNGGYRSISLEGLITLKIAGQEYVVRENKDLLEKLNQ